MVSPSFYPCASEVLADMLKTSLAFLIHSAPDLGDQKAQVIHHQHRCRLAELAQTLAPSDLFLDESNLLMAPRLDELPVTRFGVGCVLKSLPSACF